MHASAERDRAVDNAPRNNDIRPRIERRGYRRTDVTSPFPENEPRFGLPKVKGLTFIELVKSLHTPPAFDQ